MPCSCNEVPRLAKNTGSARRLGITGHLSAMDAEEQGGRSRPQLAQTIGTHSTAILGATRHLGSCNVLTTGYSRLQGFYFAANTRGINGCIKTKGKFGRFERLSH